MNADTVWVLVRYALIALGGWLTNKGFVDADTWTTVVGALGTLFVATWGIFVRWNTNAVPSSVAASPSVPTVSAATGTVKS